MSNTIQSGGPLAQAAQLEMAVATTIKRGTEQQAKLALDLIQSATQPALNTTGPVGTKLNIVA